MMEKSCEECSGLGYFDEKDLGGLVRVVCLHCKGEGKIVATMPADPFDSWLAFSDDWRPST